MKYWHSLLLIGSWLFVLTVVGRGIARLLSNRLQPIARLFLAPAMGLSFFVILATSIEWLVGARPWIVVGATVLVSVVALLFERNWHGCRLILAWQLAAGLVVSFGVLASILYSQGYDIFNDTFTYLVHAQWLQTHAFVTPVEPNALAPAYTQVLLYQNLGLRMGASFFLAWVQAASPFEWSIDVYPAVAALALIAGSLAIGGLIEALVPRSRRIAVAWSVAAGAALSGFSYGALSGFLSQMYGLALIPALLALLVQFRPEPPGQRIRSLSSALPLAMIVAAIGFAYSELLPLVSLTLLLWFVVRLMTERPAAATWILAALVFGVETVLLWNVECLRVYRALGAQSKALTGGAVPWSLLEFLGFASGWRSGPSDGGHWLVSLPAIAEALLPLSIGFLAVWPLIRYRRQLQPLLRFAAPIVYVGVCFLGVLYFRNVAASPWPVGVGQTWSEFKLSNWVSPVLLALAGAGVAALGRGSFRATSWICVLVIWTVASIHANSQLAKTRVAEVLRQTGRSHDPFESYREMRTLMFMAKPQETVYLDLGGSAVKSRQFAAYFLHDYPIAADWSDDAYIHPWLPKGWQDVSLTDCGWWLRRIAEANSPPKRGLSFRTGAFELRPSPDFRAVRDTVTGGYGIESDASGWWVWTPDRLEVRFRVRSMLPGEARLRFQYLANRLPRSLIVTTTGGSEARTDTIALAPAWQTWVSASFTVVAEEVVVRFSSPESPVPIGDADSRLAAFLIKNVRLEPSNDSVRALSPR